MDNKLKCDATTCVHNVSHLCGAAAITVHGGDTEVGQDTFCSTYAHRGLANYVTGAANMNIGGGLAQMVSSEDVMDPKVNCTAVNCVYNAQEVCHAGELRIEGETSEAAEQTVCETFKPR